MGEPGRQYEPVDLLEFKRRLLARVDASPTPAEDRLAELARIVGGQGRIVSANSNFRDEASARGEAPEEAQATPLPNTDAEPVRWPAFPAEDQSPHYASDDPQVGEDVDHAESAHREWRSHEVRARDEDEDFVEVPSENAQLRLRNRKRRHSSLYVTVAALLIAGGLAVFFVRPGASPGPLADHRADTVALASSPPAGSAALSDVAAGAQLPSTPPAEPVSDDGTAGVPTAVPANSPSPPSDDGLFLQPRRVQTIPIYNDGTFAGPANTPQNDAPNASVPGLTFGQVVEAQTLQTPAPVAAGRQTQPGSATGPTNGRGKDVASAELPKASAPATKPAPGIAAAGAAYAAILASPATESAARGMLAELQRKYGAALGAHRLTYHRANGSNGTVYEVRTSGLADDEAQALCAKLSSAGASCKVGAQ